MPCGSGCLVFIFAANLVLEGFDFVSDWIIFVDAQLSERGLVYGPVEPAVVYCLLAFSILGTIFFPLEMVNLWCEKFRDDPWIDPDLASIITLVFEDLPQIALNVYMVWCREEPISYFQLLKAAITFVLLLTRIGLTIHDIRKARRDKRKPCDAMRGTLLFLLFINAFCATCVFVFTNTNRSAESELQFRVPQSIVEDEYNDARFYDVSVFVHHPDYDAYRSATNNDQQFNWVRLMPINDIRNSDNTIHYKYAYQKTPTELRMALWKRVDKPQKGPWEFRECGKMDLQSGSLTFVNSSTCQGSFISDPVNVYITFSFLWPETIFRKRIFGDILYNLKVDGKAGCLDYDNISHDLDQASKMPIIHYFRPNSTLMDAARSSHLALEDGIPRFYRNDKADLLDVAELWRTGFWNCKSTGNMGPTLSRDIRTGCDI